MLKTQNGDAHQPTSISIITSQITIKTETRTHVSPFTIKREMCITSARLKSMDEKTKQKIGERCRHPQMAPLMVNNV
jgi:hypothetical protein